MEQFLVQFPKLGLEFNLSREAFIIGDFAVYWYAILIAIGAVLAIIYATHECKRYGILSDKLIDVAIVALIFGVIGARAYYVLFNLSEYSSFAEMINIRDGGLAIYGGLILGILAGFVTCKLNKTKFLPALDIAAGGFFIGQAIGRWGNFVNQEAFGTNTDGIFGMYSQKTQAYLESVGWDLFKQGVEVNPSQPVHPCFLYESVWCIIGILIILLVYRRIRKFDGEIFLFYGAWYGLGRGLIEGIRTDSLMIGNFRVSQLVSFALCAIAVLLIVFLRIRIAKKRKENPEYLQLYCQTRESKEQFCEDVDTALTKAETLISEASDALDNAESKIKSLKGDDGEAVELSQDEFTQMADDLTSDDEILETAFKLVDLSMTKLYLASSILERFGSDDENAELLAEEQIASEPQESEEIEQTEAEGDEFAQLLTDCEERILSVRFFLNELKEICETQRSLELEEDLDDNVDEAEPLQDSKITDNQDNSEN